MEDGRILKDIFYGELASGKRPKGRPQLRYKDVCKRDMKALDIDPKSWEVTASDRSRWRRLLHNKLIEGEDKINNAAMEKRARRKDQQRTGLNTSTFICSKCRRDCHSRIGLISHNRRC